MVAKSRERSPISSRLRMRRSGSSAGSGCGAGPWSSIFTDDAMLFAAARNASTGSMIFFPATQYPTSPKTETKSAPTMLTTVICWRTGASAICVVWWTSAKVGLIPRSASFSRSGAKPATSSTVPSIGVMIQPAPPAASRRAASRATVRASGAMRPSSSCARMRPSESTILCVPTPRASAPGESSGEALSTPLITPPGGPAGLIRSRMAMPTSTE